MRSPRENRKAIFEYIRDKGRVRKHQLEEDFVISPIKIHINLSKQGLYNTLDRLESDGKIRKINIPTGKKSVVYYELPLVDTIAQAKQFILNYKKENGSNPDLEEIAIGLGKTPEDIKPAVYAVANELEWENSSTTDKAVSFPSGKALKKTRPGLQTQDLNKEEIQIIFENLSNVNTEEAAANYLMIISSRQPILKYPHFIKNLLNAIKIVKTESAQRELLSSLYYMISSPMFQEALEQESVSKEFDSLMDELYKIASSEAYTEGVRAEAIRALGMRMDKRIISMLVNSLKKATNSSQYPLQGAFDSWILGDFYKKYKTQLASEVFNISKENKEGAKILIQLINRNWS